MIRHKETGGYNLELSAQKPCCNMNGATRNQVSGAVYVSGRSFEPGNARRCMATQVRRDCLIAVRRGISTRRACDPGFLFDAPIAAVRELIFDIEFCQEAAQHELS